MIEELHGRRETVLHPATQAFRLYMNIEAENYPAHWHTDLEIIMPIENIYTAVIEKQSYCLEPNDIFIIHLQKSHSVGRERTNQRRNRKGRKDARKSNLLPNRSRRSRI